MPNPEQNKWEEQNEQAGKRIHLLLYGNENENDNLAEWRADLEVAILDWLNIYKERISQTRQEAIEEMLKFIEKKEKRWLKTPVSNEHGQGFQLGLKTITDEIITHLKERLK